jgi:hypothetical protein
MQIVQDRQLARADRGRGGGREHRLGAGLGHGSGGALLVDEREPELGPVLGIAEPDGGVGLDPEALEPPTVDVGAVARAGVFREPGAVDRAQPQVLARDQPVVDAQPRLASAPDGEGLARLRRDGPG